MNREQRIEDAFGQLTRYGNPYYDEIIDILELLTDINDDLWHSRHKSLTTTHIEEIKTLLDSIESK